METFTIQNGDFLSPHVPPLPGPGLAIEHVMSPLHLQLNHSTKQTSSVIGGFYSL